MHQEMIGLHSLGKPSFVLITNSNNLNQHMLQLKNAGCEVVFIHNNKLTTNNNVLNFDLKTSELEKCATYSCRWSEVLAETFKSSNYNQPFCSVIEDEEQFSLSTVRKEFSHEQPSNPKIIQRETIVSTKATGGSDFMVEINSTVQFASALADKTIATNTWTPQSSLSTSPPVVKTPLELSPTTSFLSGTCIDDVIHMPSTTTTTYTAQEVVSAKKIVNSSSLSSHYTDENQLKMDNTSLCYNTTSVHSLNSQELLADAFHKHVLVSSTLFRLLQQSLITRIFQCTERVALGKWRKKALITCLRAFKTLLVQRAKKRLKVASSYLFTPYIASHLSQYLNIESGRTITNADKNIIKDITDSQLHINRETVHSKSTSIPTNQKREGGSSKLRHSLL